MRRGIPYFLLFSVYAIVNTYLPIMLKTFGFSTADIGIFLGIIEIAGVCVPFFITPQLDKTGRYAPVMSLLGLDIAFLLLPLLRFHSFFITAVCLGLFAVGLKGIVPVLDGFTAKALGRHNARYGKIRALGSIGFVCTNVFLQLSPVISGKNPLSVILSVSIGALVFVAALQYVPHLRSTPVTNTGMEHKNETERSPVPKTVTAFPKPFWECLLLIFLAFLGLAPSQRFFSLYIEEYIKIEAAAGLWALSATAEIPLLIISGKLIERFGKERLLAVCLFSIVIRNISYIILPGISGAVVGQLLHSIGFGLFHPLSVLLCASHSGGRTATAMTFYTAVNGIANVISSMSGGYIIEYAGYPALFLFFSLFPLIGIGLSFSIMRKTFGYLQKTQKMPDT